jgi:hypothetical protein
MRGRLVALEEVEAQKKVEDVGQVIAHYIRKHKNGSANQGEFTWSRLLNIVAELLKQTKHPNLDYAG